MNPTVITYLGFIVAALIVIWAVLEVTARMHRRKKIDAKTMNTWVKLDSSHRDAGDDLLPGIDDNYDEASPERKLQLRAHQNGHHSESESQKML